MIKGNMCELFPLKLAQSLMHQVLIQTLLFRKASQLKQSQEVWSNHTLSLDLLSVLLPFTSTFQHSQCPLFVGLYRYL